MDERATLFLAKAGESLEGAESELVNGRYNNAANRAYYACFQAAIAALLQEHIRPAGLQWGHDFVQAAFIGQLINRRKIYSAAVRGSLERSYALRVAADYEAEQVGQTQALRSVRRSHEFLEAVEHQTGGK